MDKYAEKQNAKKFAVVTGGSSGIGFELAKLLTVDGYDLLIASNSSAIHDAASVLRTISGQFIKAVQVDLAKEIGVKRLFSEIQSVGFPVDVLALNAGVGVGGDFATQTELIDELNLIDLNVRSTVHLAKLIGQRMVKRGQGKILFTSSIAAMLPGTYEAVYNASKAFIQSFAQAIREEMKDSGVTVTALQPGPTDTNFFHRAHMDDTKLGSGAKDDAADVARDGYEALMAGRDHIVAGSFKNKIISTGGKLLPETIGAAIHGTMSKPGTAEKSH